jgi:hypothetical protein
MTPGTTDSLWEISSVLEFILGVTDSIVKKLKISELSSYFVCGGNPPPPPQLVNTILTRKQYGSCNNIVKEIRRLGECLSSNQLGNLVLMSNRYPYLYYGTYILHKTGSSAKEL